MYFLENMYVDYQYGVFCIFLEIMYVDYCQKYN